MAAVSLGQTRTQVSHRTAVRPVRLALTVHAPISRYDAGIARASKFCATISPLQNFPRAIADDKESTMSLSLLLIIVLILLLIGALPTWGYSRSWGYRPIGGLGLVLIVVIVLLVLGVI
jgi:hypothetical protein